MAEVTDAAGRVHRTYSDPLGRTLRSIENFTDGVVAADANKTVSYGYSAAGMTSLTAHLVGGGVQTTAWVFGVSQGSGSTIDSNSVVGVTQWSDKNNGAPSNSEEEVTTINALGQTLTMTDRNGTTHELSYDVVGRLIADEVTAFGFGVDQTVARIEFAHDALGNTTLITSRDTLSAIVNQVKREFNGLGQLIAEWQEHGGAVSGSSQKVEYAWSEMPSGANHSRLVSIIYPDGYVLTFNYASGINDDVSRLSSLSDTGGTLEEYDYLGSGTVVRRGHPQPAVDLTVIGSPGAGGDQYAGLDEFGRVVDLLWVETTGPTALEHIQHSYDLLGNRLSRDNLVNSAFDEVYAYDDLSQLANFARGAHTQDWDYDALGNWDSITINGGTPETRTHNAQNQITGISGATTPVFDANGNMTGDETGRTFVYDAWHRLVEVKNGSTVLKTYRYDGINRRVSADDGTDVTDLYYSSAWQVLEERVNGNVYAHYVWSPVYVDAMVLRDRSVGGGTLNERFYVVQDANFNIVALVNTSGNVVERYAYTPFGVRTVMDASWNVIGSSAHAFEHGFQGRPFDAISATHNFRNREYSATLGRPIQVDMLRFKAGDLNFYRWVSNGPISRVDPFGLADDFYIPDGWYTDPRTGLWYKKGTSPTSGGSTGYKYNDIPEVAAKRSEALNKYIDGSSEESLRKLIFPHVKKPTLPRVDLPNPLIDPPGCDRVFGGLPVRETHLDRIPLLHPSKKTLLKGIHVFTKDIDILSLNTETCRALKSVGQGSYFSGKLPAGLAVGPDGCNACVGLVIYSSDGTIRVTHFGAQHDVYRGLKLLGVRPNYLPFNDAWNPFTKTSDDKAYLCGCSKATEANVELRLLNEAQRLGTLQDVIANLRRAGIPIEGYIPAPGFVIDSQGKLYWNSDPSPNEQYKP